MSIFRQIAAVCLAVLTPLTTVQAATIKISFDVVHVDPSLESLRALYYLDDPNRDDGGLGPVLPGSAEYAAVFLALHPLGDALGQIGRVTLKAEWLLYEDEARFSCVRGFLCDLDGGELFSYLNYERLDRSRDASGRVVQDDIILYGWYFSRYSLTYPENAPGYGRLSVDDDSNTYGGDFGGKRYDWLFGSAEFLLYNVSHKLVPVPLPAGALLLGSGLLALCLARRPPNRARRPA